MKKDKQRKGEVITDDEVTVASKVLIEFFGNKKGTLAEARAAVRVVNAYARQLERQVSRAAAPRPVLQGKRKR